MNHPSTFNKRSGQTRMSSCLSCSSSKSRHQKPPRLNGPPTCSSHHPPHRYVSVSINSNSNAAEMTTPIIQPPVRTLPTGLHRAKRASLPTRHRNRHLTRRWEDGKILEAGRLYLLAICHLPSASASVFHTARARPRAGPCWVECVHSHVSVYINPMDAHALTMCK
jgi:hypothetical protein